MIGISYEFTNRIRTLPFNINAVKTQFWYLLWIQYNDVEKRLAQQKFFKIIFTVFMVNSLNLINMERQEKVISCSFKSSAILKLTTKLFAYFQFIQIWFKYFTWTSISSTFSVGGNIKLSCSSEHPSVLYLTEDPKSLQNLSKSSKSTCCIFISRFELFHKICGTC